MDTRPEDLNDMAQRLAGLRPSDSGLDADRMLFGAGRASAARGGQVLLWKILAASLVLLAGGLTA
jgi:hypothetical protein